MTDDRTLERAARSFIEEGPTAAPPHVVEEALLRIDHIAQERDWFPWRLPKMTLPTRVAAIVALGALVVAGALALVGIGSSRGPTPTPGPSSSSIASPAISLDQHFSSPAYGYSVSYPTGWTATPATRQWTAGIANNWGSGLNDELALPGAARFSGASQPLQIGESAVEWIARYTAPRDPTTLPKVRIGGIDGIVVWNGVPAQGGTIVPGGVMFDAIVASADRVYNFNMDGRVDRATFDALLATVELDPQSVPLPTLDATAVSESYGYRIKVPAAWSLTAATSHWRGVNNEAPAVDEIRIPGTDTTLTFASQALGNEVYEDWLRAFHANTTANVPSGCDGGDPSTWDPTPIGDATGHWYELCNAAEAVVVAGGRVYAFTLSNETFDVSRHLPEQSWLRLLEGVTLEPSTAVDPSG